MELGMIGLGRMGSNMAKRLIKGGHRVFVYDRTPDKVKEAARGGARGVYSHEELVNALKPSRHIWIMLPAGKPTEDTIEDLKGRLKKGDTVIDGGNTHYKDDVRRAGELGAAGINYADAGVSGGIWGLKEGYCLMYGGDPKVCKRLEPVFRTLAPKEGYLYCGPAGAGHFVKMVHNGIEYGMMAAYGEGFSLLENSGYSQHLDFEKVAHLWNRGSVIRSWLLELAEAAFKKDRRLESIEGYVEDSGEGRWTVEQAIESAVPLPVIGLSLFGRFGSRGGADFSNRLQAALRNEFGGHAVRKARAVRKTRK
ncbi:MAG: decarboxylating 6-phosphogluconate dehydrogenase [Nitrospiraceae bacterium]|nr:decarboxylating 6-phosphogluconate dehydrogenase [Nitrospiraceae bacterium]